MSIYVDLHCLFHAVRSNTATEVAFIVRHSPKQFVSNTYLMMAIEEGKIAAASELLKRWKPCADISLQSLIDLVDDETFAHSAVEQIGKEIIPFDQLVVQAARLGRECWVKELARLAEDHLWNAPDFQSEIDFWTHVVHEGPEVVQLLLSHMIANIEALQPALKEAQQHRADVVAVLIPFVQRLKTIEQARVHATNKDIQELKDLLSTMSDNDIRAAYCDADSAARLPSVWLAAVPSLTILHDNIPWLLARALFENETLVVPKLLAHYNVVEESEREERKHEPNIIAAALNNPLGLKTVLTAFPVNHPHVVCAIDIAAKNNNCVAVQEILAHSPSLIGQGLFSSLSALAQNANTEVARFLVEQASDQELAMCVRIMRCNAIEFTNMDFLNDIIEPRVERWQIRQHIDNLRASAPKRKL